MRLLKGRLLETSSEGSACSSFSGSHFEEKALGVNWILLVDEEVFVQNNKRKMNAMTRAKAMKITKTKRLLIRFKSITHLIPFRVN